MSYEDSLAAFRNQVNQKFPPELSSNSVKRTSRVSEIGIRGVGRGGKYNGRSRGGRIGGRYQNYGRGRGGRTGKDRKYNSGYKRNRDDARMVQCNDGTQIEVHPSYDFTSKEWYKLPEAEKIRIREERNKYKRSKVSDSATVISEITTGNLTVKDELKSMKHRISAMESIAGSNTVGDSVMGGRNEQASLRSRNTTLTNIRSINSLRVIKISSSVTSNS